MQKIADALSCPVAYFFEGATDGAGAANPVTNLLTAEGLKLLRAFQKISSDNQRRALIRFVQELADRESEGEVSAASDGPADALAITIDTKPTKASKAARG